MKVDNVFSVLKTHLKTKPNFVYVLPLEVSGIQTGKQQNPSPSSPLISQSKQGLG